MKKITAILIMLIVSASLVGDCWDDQEVADLEFAEAEMIMLLSFKDAVDCSPVVNARVQFGDKVYSTDSRGYVQLTEEDIWEYDDEDLPFTVSKNGYITLQTTLQVRAGTVINKQFLLSKELPLENIRFVLQWGKSPNDLDLHLKNRKFHVSYRNMKSVPNQARLDRDDINSYGPETITLERVDQAESYRLYVHNYSNDTSINSKAQIYVYVNNQLEKIMEITETSKRSVLILEIVNQQIKYHNTPKDVIE